MIDRFKGQRLVKWMGATNTYFTSGGIYDIVRIENEMDLVIKDNSKEEYYINEEEFQYLTIATAKDKQYIQSNELPIHLANQNRPKIEVESRELDIQINLNENIFPYWAAYIMIDTNGVFALVNHPDEGNGIKEKITLENPVIIKIPNKQKPFEVLANLFKEGKITFEELEAETRTLRC